MHKPVLALGQRLSFSAKVRQSPGTGQVWNACCQNPEAVRAQGKVQEEAGSWSSFDPVEGGDIYVCVCVCVCFGYSPQRCLTKTL
jgi:hypothetical protein